MKIFALFCSVAALFFGSSCERHDWKGEEGTENFFPSHGAHGEKHEEKGHDAKEEEAGHEGHGH